MEQIVIGNKLNKKTQIKLGRGLPTRINLIVGTNSKEEKFVKEEMKKIDLGARFGVDTITDLSMVRLKKPLWMYVKEKYPQIAVGLNPPYLLFAEDHQKIIPIKLLKEIEWFVKNGVDFFTINFFPETLDELKKYMKTRLVPITSRQGGMIAKYMLTYKVNNPYSEILNELIPLFKKYNITINIGSTFRPAGITEAYDHAHKWEIEKQMEMYKKLDEMGIQSLVEIMSHQPLHQIGSGILNIRKKCGGYVPFQFLGPIVTDIASGEYDYVASAIGAAEAARYNVGKVTVIPANEHVRFPTLNDVKKGIIATKIAVHAGDLTRISGLIEIDKIILEMRAKKRSCNPFSKNKGCNKCGPYCPLILVDNYSL
jgi:phosphomethylpyrimidine synthase